MLCAMERHHSTQKTSAGRICTLHLGGHLIWGGDKSVGLLVMQGVMDTHAVT